MGEQDFGASGRVKQGTQARIGKILGADIILAGAVILKEAIVQAGARVIEISMRGLRWGLLYDRFDSRTQL